jgi:hypothetical protein
MLFSGLSLFWYFIFVAAYLENVVSHRYINGNRSKFIMAILDIYGHFYFGEPRS